MSERQSAGYYRNFIRTHSKVWAFSAALSLICTLITYPGIWYSDSYHRINLSTNLLRNLYLMGTGHGAEVSEQSWLTVVPSYFMAVSKALTWQYGLYTFAQAFAFFAATFLLVRRLGAPHPLFQQICWGLNPLIFCVSVYYEAGIGCVTGTVFLLLILLSAKTEKKGADRAIELSLLVFFSFVTYGYRANAFTMIPVFAAAILLANDKMRKKAVMMTAMAFGISLIPISARLLRIDTMSSASAGFVWEILTVIQHLEPERQSGYMEYLDEVGGPGSTAVALHFSHEDSVNGFLWGTENLSALNLSKKGASSIVLKKYLELMRREPKTYLQVKLEFTGKTLGIGKKLNLYEWDYNRQDLMEAFQFNDSPHRHFFLDAYSFTNGALAFFTMRPWAAYVLSILLVGLEYAIRGPQRKVYLFILLLSISYYAAYLINTQSFELRYFYPSLYLMMIPDLAIALDCLARFTAPAMKK